MIRLIDYMNKCILNYVEVLFFFDIIINIYNKYKFIDVFRYFF